jgi:hypothetical protein
MRREIIRWIAIIVLLVAVGVLLSALLGNRHIITLAISSGALGMSLGALGITLVFRTRWPEPGQVDPALVVFMLRSILPYWLVAIGVRVRWRIRWRFVANGAWGTLFLISLTSIAATLFGDSVTALGLAAAVLCLNLVGSLFMALARLPAGRRQR